MPPRKKVPPTPGPMWSSLEDEDVYNLDDLVALREALESTETALQGIAALKYVDMILLIDSKVVACHHDGQKWWVKFQ